jgi:hypothetical protein
MPIKLNINTDDVVGLTRKLERMGKRSLPKAVGSTLNRLAFETKKQLPKEYEKKGFEQRQKNFFRFSSRFEKVKSFDVKKMQSKAGIADVTNSSAAKNMEQQEKGGSVDKTFTPTKQARIGKDNSRKVSRKNLLSSGFRIPKQGSAFRVKKGDKKAFVKQGSVLAKKGGGVLVYGKSVFRVVKFRKNKRLPLKVEYIYTENQSKKVKIKGRHVVSDTGVKVGKKAERFFMDAAKRFLK